MQDTQSVTGTTSEATRVQPSSSRMLTNYLADVEQNLDEHRWDRALQDVIDLPRIAVALTDPQLRSTPEQCKAWCEEWIRPSDAAANDAGNTDVEHVCRVLGEKADQQSDSTVVPSIALRRLRLRRHARRAARAFNSTRARVMGDAAETAAVCNAVVEGVRRWYANFACHNATAQANLARLAVLR